MGRVTFPRLALLVLLVGVAMNNIDVAVVNVAGPAVHADPAASGAGLQLIVSGYVIAFAALMITGARPGDREAVLVR
jgi:MFS family permease